MALLDFGAVTGNVAGNPSLAKAEIVSLYRAWMELHGSGAARAAGSASAHGDEIGHADQARQPRTDSASHHFLALASRNCS